jgi:hypothetical protein
MMSAAPRYPEIHVRVSSPNPLTLVAAVRCALRQAHVGREEIWRFSQEAFARKSPRGLRQVCRKWVRIDSREGKSEDSSPN